MTSTEIQKQRIAGELLSDFSKRCDNRTTCLVMLLVSEAEGVPYDVSSLAHAIGMKRPTVYRMLAILDKAGEVETYRHQNNITRTLIKLTPKGRRIAQGQVKQVHELLDRLGLRRRSNPQN